MSVRSDRIRQLEHEIKARQDEIGRLFWRPLEPPNNSVITFRYRFAGGTKFYSYSAIRCNTNAGRALWCTTGPLSPKNYSWDELWDWFDEGEVVDVRIVTHTQPIGRPGPNFLTGPTAF